ncbi:MAG TPA: LuxR C-terminal-related transcriptional regulator [Streptosporangiaceae bacterium]|nr:LuxR C-terminal-related transcriptional regulator [Streptosporangiaceae bacterium]
MGVVEELVRAREAYDRREWLAAYGGLSDTAPGELTADDFVRLATAAFLLGRRNDCVQALQRAHQLSLDAGDTLAAVRSAFWLALVLMTGGETAIGGGWVARSQRLLAGLDSDVVERGYLLIHEMYRLIGAGELDSAYPVAEQVTGYGHRFGDPDLIAMGLSGQGRLLLYGGRVPDGLALLDESMVGVLAGQVSVIFAGHVYCSMIEACQEIADFDRAARWTSALTTWCAEQPGLVPFTGQCAVHRGQIMAAQGAFSEALDEFDLAVQRYVADQTPDAAGLALAGRGDVLRIRGELAGARAAYDRAAGYGYEPQPGLALLWLAQGRTEAALAAVRRLLGEASDPVRRSQLLPAAMEVLLAAGQLDEATAIAAELYSIAASFGCSSLQAQSWRAAARVALEAGDPAAAMPLLRRARAVWDRLGGRYEIAQCRLDLGRALRALGDEESAVAELAAARDSFADLRAVPAERAAAALLTRAFPAGLTEREVAVLRLVAAGHTNPEIAALLVVSEKTVARHLSNIFAKLGVGSRTAAAAFAFEHQIL